MPKLNNHTPPPARYLIITRSRIGVSTLGEQVAQVSNTIPVTLGQEQDTPSDKYVLISLIPWPIIIEQLLKGNSHNVVKFRRKFIEYHPTQDLPQLSNQDNPSPGDQTNE